MSYSRDDRGIFVCIFISIIIIVGLILGLYFGLKGSKDSTTDIPILEHSLPFILTEGHKSRVSLLQQCMNIYGEKDIPELKNEKFNSTIVSENKVLSISKLEINGEKGETVQIFKYKETIEEDEGEYTCISFKFNNIDYMEKIINGSFTIPKNLDTEVNKTEFTFILYFFYDPIINDIEYQNNLNEQNDSTSLFYIKIKIQEKGL